MRAAVPLAVLLIGGCDCAGREVPPPGPGAADARSSTSDAAESDASSGDASIGDRFIADSAAPDVEPDADVSDLFDVHIFVANNCDVTTTPASITVPAGTAFTVHWFNEATSASNADIAKIDPFNQVPIVIGLEPGNDYHDQIREWCGTLFQGMFDFRITGCFDPYYLLVDCSQ